MKIALIGYGKMGHAIERIATSQGHEVVLRITAANPADLTAENLRTADVAIEFTAPYAAAGNVAACLAAGVPVVSGTTGWNDELQAAKTLAQRGSSAFIHASNFSIGVNIFFAVNQRLAGLMKEQPQYSVDIEEVHHLQKLDKPSGTAITLAEGIIGEVRDLAGWKLADADDSDAVSVPIVALREEGVPGTHTISWRSADDTISLQHTANSRDGFAAGAVLAAGFLIGKTGVFTMQDVLHL